MVEDSISFLVMLCPNWRLMCLYSHRNVLNAQSMITANLVHMQSDKSSKWFWSTKYRKTLRWTLSMTIGGLIKKGSQSSRVASTLESGYGYWRGMGGTSNNNLVFYFWRVKTQQTSEIFETGHVSRMSWRTKWSRTWSWTGRSLNGRRWFDWFRIHAKWNLFCRIQTH